VGLRCECAEEIEGLVLFLFLNYNLIINDRFFLYLLLRASRLNVSFISSS